jgi:hypothetical protein
MLFFCPKLNGSGEIYLEGTWQLNVLKIDESKASARSPLRLFVLVKLIWLPACASHHDCQTNQINVDSHMKEHGDWLDAH